MVICLYITDFIHGDTGFDKIAGTNIRRNRYQQIKINFFPAGRDNLFVFTIHFCQIIAGGNFDIFLLNKLRKESTCFGFGKCTREWCDQADTRVCRLCR